MKTPWLIRLRRWLCAHGWHVWYKEYDMFKATRWSCAKCNIEWDEP